MTVAGLRASLSRRWHGAPVWAWVGGAVALAGAYLVQRRRAAASTTPAAQQDGYSTPPRSLYFQTAGGGAGDWRPPDYFDPPPTPVIPGDTGEPAGTPGPTAPPTTGTLTTGPVDPVAPSGPDGPLAPTSTDPNAGTWAEGIDVGGYVAGSGEITQYPEPGTVYVGPTLTPEPAGTVAPIGGTIAY